MKLSAKQRKAIYGVMSAVVALLVAFNVITADKLADIAQSVVLVAGTLTTVLAYKNTDPMQDVDPNIEDESIGGTDADD